MAQWTHRKCRFDSWARKFSWGRKWQPPSVFLLGKSHGQRSLAGYSLWGHKELDMTGHIHMRGCLLLVIHVKSLEVITSILTIRKNSANVLNETSYLGFLDSSVGKESAAMPETPVQFLGWEDPVEKG